MKKGAILMVTLLVLPIAASARNNMKGPQGVLMGLLKDPPKVAPGEEDVPVVVLCSKSQMQELDQKIAQWQDKVASIRDDERSVGETAAGLAAVYNRYPAQAYFKEMASAINGANGLTAYLQSISDDLGKAKRCVWNDYKDGCWHVPSDGCFDEGQIAARISQSAKSVQALIDNLNQRRRTLLRGLPTGVVYKVGDEIRLYSCSQCIPVQCSAAQPPCQQHMAAAVDTINQAQEAIENKY